MHHLFIDVSRELKAGREIQIYDPFFEQIIGYSSGKNDQSSQSTAETQEQEIDCGIADVKNGDKSKKYGQLMSDSKKKHIKDYNLDQMQVQSFLFKDVSIMQNIQIQETLKRHIVYLFALPQDFNHEEFLAKSLEHKYEHVQSIRIFQEFNGDKKQKKSIVLYFNDKDAAEDYVQEYNCFTINEKNEEYMFIISLQFITYLANSEQLQHAMEDQQKANLVDLPNCPLCIEKLESVVSGFSLSIALNLFIYDVPNRWQEAKEACNTCMDREIQNCSVCFESDLEGLWICLICGNMGCGRYKKGHAKDHWYQSGHCLSMEVQSERIWDYFDDKFVHRVMKGENRKTIIMNNFEKLQPLQDMSNRQTNQLNEQQIGNEQEIVLSRESNQQRSQQPFPNNNHMMMWDQWNEIKGMERLENKEEKFLSDRVDNAIWEYCYVVSHQMEEQRKFFEKKLEDVKSKNEDILEEREEENNALEDEIKCIKEKREKVKRNREATARKQKTISDKNKEMESDIEKVELFIKGIRNNIEHFETKQAQQLLSTQASQSANSSSSSSSSSLKAPGDELKPNNKFSCDLEQEILQESSKLQLLEQQLSSLYEQLSAE